MLIYKKKRSFNSKSKIKINRLCYKKNFFNKTNKYGVYKRKKIRIDKSVLKLSYKWKMVFEADSNADLNFQNFWYYDKKIDVLIFLKSFNKSHDRISINFPYNVKIICYTFSIENFRNMSAYTNEIIENLMLVLIDKFSIGLKNLQQVEKYNPSKNDRTFSAQVTIHNKQTKRIINDTFSQQIKYLLDDTQYITSIDQNLNLRAYKEIVTSENIVGNYLTLYGILQENVPNPYGGHKAQKYVDAFIRRVYAILLGDSSYIEYEKNYDTRMRDNNRKPNYQMNDYSFINWINELTDSETKVGNNLFEIDQSGGFVASQDQYIAKVWLENIIGYQLKTLDNENEKKLIEVETSEKNKSYHETIYSSVRNEIGHFSNDIEYYRVIQNVDKYYYGLVMLVKLVL